MTPTERLHQGECQALLLGYGNSGQRALPGEAAPLSVFFGEPL